MAMSYRISGEDSLKKFLQMAESEFINKERSTSDHLKTIEFLRSYLNPEILELANRMEYEIEILNK
jgi:hypothetical protein